jgi:hypothetical protein
MTKQEKIIETQTEIIIVQNEIIKFREDYQGNGWTIRDNLFKKLNELNLHLIKLQSEPESKDELSEKPKYNYAKIRKAGKTCLKGISCNLCEVNDKTSFNRCLYNSEFASDDELERLGLIDG